MLYLNAVIFEEDYQNPKAKVKLKIKKKILQKSFFWVSFNLPTPFTTN